MDIAFAGGWEYRKGLKHYYRHVQVAEDGSYCTPPVHRGPADSNSPQRTEKSINATGRWVDGGEYTLSHNIVAI